MSPLIDHAFTKMNGIGNEIITLDLRGSGLSVSPAEARAIGRALPYDQLMVLLPPQTAGTEAFMKIYNNDGSESAACGNGTRCIGWSLLHDSPRDHVKLETSAGLLDCARIDTLTYRVDMGRPRLSWQEIPLAEEFADTRGIELQIGPVDAPVLHTPSVVNMGNPHAIFWVEDVNAYDLARFGPLLENHPIFPEKANISLAQVVSRSHIILKVWERGVGLTRACGSAACAAAVAAARKDLASRHVRISLPGGDLHIEWRASDDHVLMTGPVELEFEGRFTAQTFADMKG
jgi:diaminopimelate epimerase